MRHYRIGRDHLGGQGLHPKEETRRRPATKRQGARQEEGDPATKRQGARQEEGDPATKQQGARQKKGYPATRRWEQWVCQQSPMQREDERE